MLLLETEFNQFYRLNLYFSDNNIGVFKTVDDIFWVVDIPDYVSKILNVISFNRRTKEIIYLCKYFGSDKTHVEVTKYTETEEYNMATQ